MHQSRRPGNLSFLRVPLAAAINWGCPQDDPTDPVDNGTTTPAAAPSVSATTPGGGATGVSVNTSISATFTKAMDAASFGSGSMQVSGGVTGTVGVSGSTATFAPAAALAYGTAVVVPAGTYTAARARHASSESGQYATEHWNVLETEYWADGVGLVLSTWSNSFDDKDPQGADVSQRGRIELTHAETGAFPAFTAEAEANDSANTAGALALPRTVVEGGTPITHPGAVMTSSLLGCADQCVAANEDGVARVADRNDCAGNLLRRRAGVEHARFGGPVLAQP